MESTKLASVADPLARLRASKNEFEEQEAKDGAKAGRRWAEEDAEYSQLSRLMTAFDDDALAGELTPDEVCSAMDPEERLDGRELDNFWVNNVGEQHPSSECLAAFIEAAVAVAREV